MRIDAKSVMRVLPPIAAAALMAMTVSTTAWAAAAPSSPEPAPREGEPALETHDTGASEEDDDGPRVRSPRTVTAGLELSIVGLSFGQRSEFLWRMGGPGSVSHMRVHLGMLAGPEFVFVPMGLGYRAIFREDMTVQPFIGLGYEAHFFLTDGPVFSQLATVYGELGCGFAIDDDFSVGAGLSVDWTVAGERGPGLQTRLFTGYRF
jgi:hypothetical protein